MIAAARSPGKREFAFPDAFRSAARTGASEPVRD
jgi:hypothetical protein